MTAETKMICARKRDFIGVYENALTAEFCERVTMRFRSSPTRSAGQIGHGIDREKKNSIDLGIGHLEDWSRECDEFRRATHTVLRDYLETYYFGLIGGVAAHVVDPGENRAVALTPENWERLGVNRLDYLIEGIFRIAPFNLQEYVPNTGHYRYWHHEHYPRDPSSETLHRVLFVIFYLNDVNEGGQTDFFYQDLRISPRRGRVVIAPCGFTHTHRGSIPLSNAKFIATSWILFQRAEQLYRGHGAKSERAEITHQHGAEG